MAVTTRQGNSQRAHRGFHFGCSSRRRMRAFHVSLCAIFQAQHGNFASPMVDASSRRESHRTSEAIAPVDHRHRALLRIRGSESFNSGVHVSARFSPRPMASGSKIGPTACVLLINGLNLLDLTMMFRSPSNSNTNLDQLTNQLNIAEWRQYAHCRLAFSCL